VKVDSAMQEAIAEMSDTGVKVRLSLDKANDAECRRSRPIRLRGACGLMSGQTRNLLNVQLCIPCSHFDSHQARSICFDLPRTYNGLLWGLQECILDQISVAGKLKFF
jgi:hypothetical protein